MSFQMKRFFAEFCSFTKQNKKHASVSSLLVSSQLPKWEGNETHRPLLKPKKSPPPPPTLLMKEIHPNRTPRPTPPFVIRLPIGFLHDDVEIERFSVDGEGRCSFDVRIDDGYHLRGGRRRKREGSTRVEQNRKEKRKDETKTKTRLV